MRKLAFGIATATAIVATPAVARDQQWYAGPELGVIFPEDTDYERRLTGEQIFVEQDQGWDGDILVGYDFGMLRLEAEAGYKTWDVESLLAPTPGVPGATFAPVSRASTPK